MPKITFTDPAGPTKRKWGGTHFFKVNDEFRARQKASYKKRNNYLLKIPNMTFCDAAVYWSLNAIANAVNWLDYQPSLGKSKTAYNKAIANNIRLAYHLVTADPKNWDLDLAAFVGCPDISNPETLPDYPPCIEAWFDSDGDRVIVNWKDIYWEETYLAFGTYRMDYSGYFWPDWRYRIRAAEIAGEETLSIPGSVFKAGHPHALAIRACNQRGEISPYSPPIEIDIPDRPVSAFTATPRSGEPPLDVQFTNLTTGDIKSYLWDFGDGCFSYDKDPSHVYEGLEEYYSPKLTAFGVCDSKKTYTRHNYIHLKPVLNADPFSIVCDTLHHRIFKRETSNLKYINQTGSFGTGDGEFNQPVGVATDSTHTYITDKLNNRIQKFSKLDMSFVETFGTYGSGNDQFSFPAGIAVDGEHLFIWDYNNQRIHKRNKIDFSLVDMLNKIDSGDARFRYGMGLAVDDFYLYVCCSYFSRIVVFDKSTLTYVKHLDDDNIDICGPLHPKNVFVDNIYIYIVNFVYPGYEIQKRRKSDFCYNARFQLWTVSREFTFIGVGSNGSHIFTSDPAFNYICKWLASSGKLIKRSVHIEDVDDQFNLPYGLDIFLHNPPPSCVAWWQLKSDCYDDVNLTFTDQTGNNHIATNHNLTVESDYTTFDGSGYIEIENFSEISTDLKRFSMAIWANYSLINAGSLCSHYDDLDTNLQRSWWSSIEYNGNHVHRVCKEPVGIIRKEYISSSNPNDSTWHLLGFTFNDNVFKIWLDAVTDPNPNLYINEIFSTIHQSTAKFLIGAKWFQGMVNTQFTGKISKVYIFNDEVDQENWYNLLDLGH